MMYLVTTSAALRLGGPAYPGSRPNGGMSRNGSRTGSASHTLSFSQSLVAPSAYPCCDVNHSANTGLGLIRFRSPLGFDVDRGAVVGGADAAREEGAVVAAIVPGKPTLVAGVFPKTNRELDRFDGFPAVQDHRLAVGLDLLATPRP